MSYLDASFVMSFLVEDVHSEKADHWWSGSRDEPILSAFACAEFCAAISRGVRIGKFSADKAHTALADLDALRRQCEPYWPDYETFEITEYLIRDFALKLAAPDALHLASAMQLGAPLATFDERLANAAREKKIELAL